MKNPFKQIDYLGDDVSRPAGSGATLERYDQRDTSPSGVVASIKATLRREAARRLDKQVQCEACTKRPATRVVPFAMPSNTEDDSQFCCICQRCFDAHKAGSKTVTMDARLNRATRSKR